MPLSNDIICSTHSQTHTDRNERAQISLHSAMLVLIIHYSLQVTHPIWAECVEWRLTLLLTAVNTYGPFGESYLCQFNPSAWDWSAQSRDIWWSREWWVSTWNDPIGFFTQMGKINCEKIFQIRQKLICLKIKQWKTVWFSATLKTSWTQEFNNQFWVQFFTDCGVITYTDDASVSCNLITTVVSYYRGRKSSKGIHIVWQG